MRFSLNYALRFLYLVSFATVLGCGSAPQMDYSKVDLLSVSGTITLDGQPLKNAVVTFEAVDTGMFSYGMTNGSGNYELQFDSVKDGVTPGIKRVEISTTRKILGLNSEDEGGGETEEGEATNDSAAETVPACYNHQSGLQVTVSDTQTKFDFDLKSDCSTTGPTQ